MGLCFYKGVYKRRLLGLEHNIRKEITEEQDLNIGHKNIIKDFKPYFIKDGGRIGQVVGILLDVDNKCTYPGKQKELLERYIIEVIDGVYQWLDDIYQFIEVQLSSISSKTKK